MTNTSVTTQKVTAYPYGSYNSYGYVIDPSRTEVKGHQATIWFLDQNGKFRPILVQAEGITPVESFQAVR